MQKGIRSMNISKATEDAVGVLMFDQWLRHYYVVRREGKLYVFVPEEKMAESKSSFLSITGWPNCLTMKN